MADSQFDIASVAQHVCLSPSRLSHLFRQQLGVSVLSWREDQRISQAKLLLSTTECLLPPWGATWASKISSILAYLKNAPGPAESEFRAGCE
ncbi:AraC family transcriptional regulator [Enterobacter mori]